MYSCCRRREIEQEKIKKIKVYGGLKMKFLTERQLLRHATSLPLIEINSEDVHTTLNMNENIYQGASATSSSHCTLKPPSGCQTPAVFRKPSPQRFCQTPFRNKHKLVNLSYSQPSSPRTPCMGSKKKVCATPFVKPNGSHGNSNECFIPPTPMIANSVEMLICTVANMDALGVIPDILEIIDNETHLTDTVDRQLKLLSDTELNDETVVDYIMDLSQEVKSKHSRKTDPQDHHPERGRVRKKSRYTKLMSEEEREALKRIQKEKSRQKRKQRFREPPAAGTRRSKRIRHPVKSYTSST